MAMKKIMLFLKTAYSSGSSFEERKKNTQGKVSLFSCLKFFYDDVLIQKYFEYYNGSFFSKLSATLH